MLRRFVLVYDDILVLAFRGHLNGAPRVLTVVEMGKLRAVAETFEPLAQFVRWAEGDQYVTLSLVPVMLARCFRTVDNVAGQSTTVTELKNALRGRMQARLGSILTKPNLALAAAALDPKYGHLKFVHPDVRDAVWADLAKWAVEWPAPETAAVDYVGVGAALPPEDALGFAVYESHLKIFRDVFEASAPIDELDLREGDAETALQYWAKAHRERVAARHISHLARIVFGIPATSAPSEREFSSANLIVSSLRSGLDPQTVIDLVTVRAHVRREGIRNFIQFCDEEFSKRAKKRPVK